MRFSPLILAGLLAGCATGAETQQPTAPVDDGTATLSELRTVRSRVRHGDGPKVHAELAAQLQQRPGDKHVLFLDTAAGMPSEAAWQAFKSQAADTPNDPWPLLAMAMTYLEWGMVPQASQTLDKVEALKPGYVPTALVHAQLLQKENDPSAKAAYEALKARADLPEIHAGLGELAIAAGDVATAKTELQLASKGDAATLDVEKALAAVAKQDHDDVAGLAAWKEIVAMSPQDGQAMVELAKLEESQGDVEGARRDFTKAADLRGIDLDTAQHLVALAKKAGDTKGLTDALTTLSRIDKDHAAPELELAQLAASQKDGKGAESHLHAALDREPKNPAILLALARQLRDDGQTRDAIEAYDNAAALPGAPPEAKAERDPLVADLKLPEKPIAGDVNRINMKFSAELNKFYHERLKAHPGMKGTLRLAVDVDASGKVLSVGVTPTGLDDEKLLLHAYFVMKQAEFPKAKRSPVFEVELKP
ncbi:MAG: hypothetical protein JST54_07270 [Deltaproteobacteria bacterium]|nr:hypothetical protein [Deltaproteobacteria bacterium]